MKLDGVYQGKNKSRVYRSFRELELIAKLQISSLRVITGMLFINLLSCIRLVFSIPS